MDSRSIKLRIVESFVVKGKAAAGNIMMLIATISGIICMSTFYILPGILLLIGGLMGVFRKGESSVSA